MLRGRWIKCAELSSAGTVVEDVLLSVRRNGESAMCHSAGAHLAYADIVPLCVPQWQILLRALYTLLVGMRIINFECMQQFMAQLTRRPSLRRIAHLCTILCDIGQIKSLIFGVLLLL